MATFISNEINSKVEGCHQTNLKMGSSSFFQLLKAALILTLLQLASCEVDKTLEDNATGEDAVDAVIAKIGSLFGKDYDFFKRLSLVDTQFGTKSAGILNHCLWYNTEAMFKSTKASKKLDSIYGKIYKLFGIKWREQASWDDLRKPLYSALALHLYLYEKDPSTEQRGFPQTIAEQAKYRETHLRIAYGNRRLVPNKNDFVSLVKEFEDSKKGCNAKMDFVVVLDGSGSVVWTNFKTALNFVAQLFGRYSLDTTRLGFIVYSNEVEEYLSLDSGQTPQQIDNTIKTARYPSRATNTNGGIIAALNLFRNAKPRPGVPKVLAVFTDGESNRGGKHGNGGVPDIQTARAEGITTYAVGIGPSTRPSELLEIAQGQSGRVFSINNFDTLLEFFRNLHRQTCAESQLPSFGHVTGDKLNYKEHRLYRFQWGKATRSFRITLETTQGQIAAYYGRNRGVNPAWYDGQLWIGENYLDHPDLYKQQENNVRRRRDDEGEREFNIDQIYDLDTDELPDEFYNSGDPKVTDPSEIQRYLFIYILGLHSVNKYTILVEEVDLLPTTTTTSTTTSTTTTTPTTTTTTTATSPTTTTTTPTTTTTTPTTTMPSSSTDTSTSITIENTAFIATYAPTSFLDSAEGLFKGSHNAGNSIFGNANVFAILSINIVFVLIMLSNYS